MKSMVSLKLAGALALISALASPAFAQSMPDAPTKSSQAVSSASQLLVPFPKKWWAED